MPRACAAPNAEQRSVGLILLAALELSIAGGMTVGTVTPIMNALRPGQAASVRIACRVPSPSTRLEVSTRGTSAVTLTVSPHRTHFQLQIERDELLGTDANARLVECLKARQ